jgi:hypothetical protein
MQGLGRQPGFDIGKIELFGLGTQATPKMSDWPLAAFSWARLAIPIMRSRPAISVARAWPKQSNAPAAIRLSKTRLPTIRGSMREQKSSRLSNCRSLRTATMWSTAASPTPFSAASE